MVVAEIESRGLNAGPAVADKRRRRKMLVNLVRWETSSFRAAMRLSPSLQPIRRHQSTHSRHGGKNQKKIAILEEEKEEKQIQEKISK
uniref:Uncharacterized protein n=1 Tax=Oryza sativa subsp. japonica TaxID=39947 RepID=Q6K2T4_ORYSJ|nr:hypothetical protein [Oryza sativa Japonica Group]BAD28887.1 hypothetical protein [Oryza sativa Japonica Group]